MATVGQQLLAPETGWKRYDDSDSRIKYAGAWTTTTGTSRYGGSEHYTNTIGSTINFKFYGTKLRMCCDASSSRTTNISVTIDGVKYSNITQYASPEIYQMMFYEKTGLSLGIHDVVITTNDVNTALLDSIDIDDTGDLLGTGIALTNPESGWRRYDDTDSRILKIGSLFGTNVDSGQWGTSTWIRGDSPTTTKFSFKFKGTKLRIMGIKNVNGIISKISIDGIVDTYSHYNSSIIYQALLYEKMGLTNDVHTVEISLNASATNDKWIWLDSIDIDSNGYLVHPTLNQVNSLDNMQVGDCIPCRYTATTSGVVGYFSELGTCIANEIPVTGTATPNGLFYLIKGDKGTLIADRVVQNNISWDALNNTGYIEGGSNIIPPLTSATSGGITISQSSYYDVNYGWKAFDRITGGYWYTPATPPLISKTGINKNAHWLKIDLGNPIKFNKLDLTQCNITVGQAGLKDFELYGSNDDITYTKILSNTQPNVYPKTCSYDFPEVNYRYVMLVALSSYYTSGPTSYIAIGELSLYNTTLKARSLSGGVAYADANGNLSLINKSLGGWPINNEWDKYIINSDLKGKIVKGDDNIWHSISNGTWCKDIPLNGTFTSKTGTTTGSSNICRTGRGVLNVDVWSGLWCTSSSYASTTIGFRPVLNYVESDMASEVIY